MKTSKVEDYVNQKRAAAILGVSRMTIWTWIKEGKLAVVRIADLRMVPRREIERLKRARKNK